METFRAGGFEKLKVRGDEAHIGRGEQIARYDGASKLDRVHRAKRVAINQDACGFENRGINRLLDDPSRFSGERVKRQGSFGSGHAVALTESADGGSCFNLSQCGDDLAAVVFRLGKSQHLVAALLCDE
jgi:hypothetical protein